jgi:ATP-binding cassette subfamily F protein 3
LDYVILNPAVPGTAIIYLVFSMSLITATNLGKSFGSVDLFNGLTFSVPPRARIGLVGANGVGKTTLLRILIGQDEPSSGQVLRAKGLRIGYLPQEAHFESQGTLWDECLSALRPLLERETRLKQLEAAMSRPDCTETDLHEYGRLQHEFERLGGYTYDTRIRQTLEGLGFQPGDYKRPLKQLSGGQRTRALLARLLLDNPDLLLLDEPTNHLDISAIEWLEAYLRDWDGAVMIVSHDRYFLNQAANTIWELTPGLEIYRGNYASYMQQRTERYQRRLQEYQAQQEFIEKEQEYIRRNIAGQNTRQAQGRRTRLERMLEESRLLPPPSSRRLRIRLEPTARSGDLVVRTYSLSVGYADDGKTLFEVPDLTLQRGECAAVLGPNGAGKTTFLKTLLGQVPPLKGEAVLGASLNIGYFAQAHEGLHPDKTLLEEIEFVAPHMLPAEIRDYLATFFFTGDDVFKQVSMLSGGERGRLALACLALQGANLLLLDEPTNHLDLPSQEVLQAILADYRGTILLVSHDRYLIDALATQVWEVLPQQHQLRVFDGAYSEYAAFCAVQVQTQAATQPTARPQHQPAIERQKSPGVSTNKERQRLRRLQNLETEIEQLEAQIAAVNHQFENPPTDPAAVQRLGQQYNDLHAALDRNLAEWNELSDA